MNVMRAVLVHVTGHELAHRRSTGLDRWDEMWEGILHTTPAPSLEHQRPEVFRLTGSQFVAMQPDGDGWLRAETMNVQFRAAEGRSALQIEDGLDTTIAVEI